MAQPTSAPVDWSKLSDSNMDELQRKLFNPPKIRGDEARVPLTTPDEARAYAERVIRATQMSDSDYYAQPPYLVEDRGGTWWVIASATKSPLFAPLHVELRKSDALVVSYGMTLKDGRVAPEVREGNTP